MQDKICMIGLGYFGLPLAVAFAEKMPKFEVMIQSRKAKMTLAQARAEIRQSNILGRIPKALKLYKNGYVRKTRLKNMIRDILG